MVKGDKFNLSIPWNLAYGEGGSGAKIGPRALLKFDVELLEIIGVTDVPEEVEPEDSDGAAEEGVGEVEEAPKEEL